MSFNGNIMNFMGFQKRMSDYPVFSLTEIRKIYGDFPYRQLDRWKKKGYLRKLKKGFYCLNGVNGVKINRDYLFYTANKIYAPSYVSLETALKYYSLIPEEIFQITSVSTKKTADFQTDIGNFGYRHIKPALYWGYLPVDFGSQKILIAEPEKAILDYLYIHPNLKTSDDFREMRIDVDEFVPRINTEKMKKYSGAFGNNALKKRVNIFLTAMRNDSA